MAVEGLLYCGRFIFDFLLHLFNAKDTFHELADIINRHCAIKDGFEGLSLFYCIDGSFDFLKSWLKHIDDAGTFAR